MVNSSVESDPAPQSAGGQSDPLTVSQAVELVRDVLAVGVPPVVRIVGEVSNFNDRGHWYFSLKDEQSVIDCVMWASSGRRCAFTPQRGQQVVAAGHFDIYGKQGRLQLYVSELQPVGQGALELRFRQLCEELRGLGYFDEARKKPLPVFPEHIAIITSAAGAALADVIRTARQRWPGIRLSVLDVRVQGDGAAQQIADALLRLSEQHERLGIDAIILTRGGGSLEDLWSFNERIVADAIFRATLPIVVGVGHETDVTIAELVADLRCSTPTQAAARLVPDAAAEREHILQNSRRLMHALRRTGQHARTRLDSLARHPIFRRPRDRFLQLHQRLAHRELQLAGALKQRAAALRQRLDAHRHTLAGIEPTSRLAAANHRLSAADSNLRAAMQRLMRDRRERIAMAQRHLGCVGHRSVLQRGYTYTTDVAGRVLRTAHDAQAAGSLVTQFADGTVSSQVTGDARGLPARPTRKRKRKKPDRPVESGLFG